MQISQTSIQNGPTSTGVNKSTCLFESASGTFCRASVMTVIMSGHQKKTYCWTDNYSSCPMFLAKILRGI